MHTEQNMHGRLLNEALAVTGLRTILTANPIDGYQLDIYRYLGLFKERIEISVGHEPLNAMTSQLSPCQPGEQLQKYPFRLSTH